MAAALDMKSKTVVDGRTTEARGGGEFAKRRRHVDDRKRIRDDVQRRGLFHDIAAKRVEQFAFERERLFARLRDAARQRRKFVGREAHGAADRLAMTEEIAVGVGLQLVGMLRRHFDEIAEYAIVLDAQLRDTAVASVSRLEPGDDPARFVAQTPDLVQWRMHAWCNEAAIAREEGWFRHEKLFEPVVNARNFGEGGDQRRKNVIYFAGRRLQRIVKLELVAQGTRALDAVAQVGQIARPAAADRNSRQSACNVGHAAQFLPRGAA